MTWVPEVEAWTAMVTRIAASCADVTVSGRLRQISAVT
jgi:hypothetical protein